jgi:hypothetical protein
MEMNRNKQKYNYKAKQLITWNVEKPIITERDN